MLVFGVKYPKAISAAIEISNKSTILAAKAILLLVGHPLYRTNENI
jgi:hypothetical protein